MFSRFTPDCTKAFRAPATRAEMMGVFHRAWTTATRSPDPGIRQCSAGEREQALDSQGRARWGTDRQDSELLLVLSTTTLRSQHELEPDWS